MAKPKKDAPKMEPTPAPEKEERVQMPIRLPAALKAALDDRAATSGASCNAIIEQALERHLRADATRALSLEDDAASWARLLGLGGTLTSAREEMPELTVGEASLICDVLNGALLLDPITAPHSVGSLGVMIYAEVADGCTLNKLDRKWEVDGKALLKKLRALTPAQAFAVVEAAHTFWRVGPHVSGEGSTEALLRGIGLVRS